MKQFLWIPKDLIISDERLIEERGESWPELAGKSAMSNRQRTCKQLMSSWKAFDDFLVV
jgi:hypothetical protein